MASAQSFGVGVGVTIGEPAYGPPVYYEAPPPVLYEQPPAVYVPAAPPVVRSSLPPPAIFDVLESEGYGEFGPMAFREGVYQLSAVNPDGDLVALEVSPVNGAVISELLLDRARSASRVVAPPAIAPAYQAPPPGQDPLVVY